MTWDCVRTKDAAMCFVSVGEKRVFDQIMLNIKSNISATAGYPTLVLCVLFH